MTGEPVADKEIPPLTSIGRVPGIVECSGRRAQRLVADGTVASVEIGRQTLVAQEDAEALAQRRAAGHDDWELGRPPTVIPPLMSSTEAAEWIGFRSAHPVRELYQAGALPGVIVGEGKDLVLRRSVVEAYALVHQIRGATRKRPGTP